MGCSAAKEVEDKGGPREIEKDKMDEKVLQGKNKERDEIEANLAVVSCENGILHGDAAQAAHSLRLSHSNAALSSKQGDLGQASGNALGKSVSCAIMPTATMDSQVYYANPDQTMIIFDWDDTLCPTAWMRQNVQVDAKGRLQTKPSTQAQRELYMLGEQVVPLLMGAMTLGKVIFVTNARRPWVMTSCEHLLPNVLDLIQRIPIIYALEFVKAPSGKHEIGSGLLTETKARAMKAAVTDFYSRYANQSWKNIVSIGDALFEHDAIRQVTAERLAAKPGVKKCRTKTIKLLERPTIAGLVVQLSIVESWLKNVVLADNDVDIDLSAPAETVNKWVAEFGRD